MSRIAQVNTTDIRAAIQLGCRLLTGPSSLYTLYHNKYRS